MLRASAPTVFASRLPLNLACESQFDPSLLKSFRAGFAISRDSSHCVLCLCLCDSTVQSETLMRGLSDVDRATQQQKLQQELEQFESLRALLDMSCGAPSRLRALCLACLPFFTPPCTSARSRCLPQTRELRALLSHGFRSPPLCSLPRVLREQRRSRSW